jgi:hypothetical protein
MPKQAKLFPTPVLFPTFFHLRCSEAMKQAIMARGGARWLRGVIQANLGAPFTDVPADAGVPFDGPVKALPARKRVKSRVSRGGKKISTGVRQRVSLDKRKAHIVK